MLNDSETILSFPMSWYPLCRSSDLKKGQVIQRQAFGILLAVFRTHTNRVGAIGAECAHMGANLAQGKVVGERLQCPLHHWQYSVCGECEHIPGCETIPSRARQITLKCQEHYGLVFAFQGQEPLFEFPHFPSPVRTSTDGGGQGSPSGSKRRGGGDPNLYSHAHRMEFDTAYQVLAANSFDGQHFATVHNRVLLEPPTATSVSPYHFGTQFRAHVGGNTLNDRLLRALGVNIVELRADCWGGNNILAYSSRTANYILFTLLPVNAHKSAIFILNVLPNGSSRARIVRRTALAVTHRLTLMFLQPDIAVMRDLQFHLGVLLPELDHSFIEWVKYWKALPTTTVMRIHEG